MPSLPCSTGQIPGDVDDYPEEAGGTEAGVLEKFVRLTSGKRSVALKSHAPVEGLTGNQVASPVAVREQQQYYMPLHARKRAFCG